MEISMVGNMETTHLVFREINNLISSPKLCPIGKSSYGQSSGIRSSRGDGIKLTAKAIQSVEPVLSNSKPKPKPKSKSLDGVKLFVGLPMDAVSECNAVNHARAVGAGLRALKLLGVEGVELPIWWGVVEKESMGKYSWSAYLALAQMVQDAGLKLHVSLCFHASKQHKIHLPRWVSKIGESEPSIFFADKSGQQYKQCLSLAVDHLPALNGKTAIQVYQEFCDSFKTAFAPFMGDTITGICMGLGPDGELRYPSQRHGRAKNDKIDGVGEFQCYDKNMLSLLKQHGEATGNPNWGLGGPHDTPGDDDVPSMFFNENGGSWETPYGDFFLSWYSSQLTAHGDRVLALASSTFSDAGVSVYGRIPVIHSWSKTRAHAAELTAGFYNTITRDGYEEVAETFARNSCKMILPSVELSDEHQPELLLARIREACRKYEIGVSTSGAMKKKLWVETVEMYTYERMRAYFFSPQHFPSFTEFVRSLNQHELDSDDLPNEDEEAYVSVAATHQMQVA